MKLTRRVAVGNVQLDEVDPSIVIRNIDTGAPDENITAVSRMGGAGQRITGAHFNSLTVTVAYAIDIRKKRLTNRRDVMDKVKAWAMGGAWLTTNENPKRRMYIERVSFSSAGDLFDWTNEYTITFRSYGIPFWQDSSVEPKSKQMTSGSIKVDVGGNVQTVLNATFENKSGKIINKFKITAGENTMDFTNLALAAKETLEITHTNTGLLRLRIRQTDGSTRTAMTRRTGADDLYVDPGTQIVTIKSERSGLLTVSAYGRWL